MGKYNADGFRFMGTEMYEFAKMMAEHLELQDAGAFEYELDEIKAAKMKKVYDALKEMLSDYDGIEVEIERSKLFHTTYAIVVKSSYLGFQSEEMLQLMDGATGVDFTAHTDGTLEMAIDFQDVLIEKLK